MKKTISFLLLFFLLLVLISNPVITVKAAAEGLCLWYEQILPTLLPFAILSDILIHSNGFYLISRWIYPILHLVFPCSKSGTFPLAAGYLFGFPMGSRICAQMVSERMLSSTEASIIFVVSNNISPIFVASYIVHNMLENDTLLLPTFLCLYLPPLLYGHLMYFRQKESGIAQRNTINLQKESAPQLKLNFSIVDAGIMNGFEVLCKLGGYIMLFRIITALMTHYCAYAPLKILLTAPLEITNGIKLLTDASLAPQMEYACINSLTAFGGICGIAQTSAMVSDAKLPMKRYLLIRLLLAGISGTTAYWIYPLFC